MTTKFNLGDRVEDTLTGIEGVIITYYFHLNGCQYIEVEPDAKDNARAEPLYMSEDRFQISKRAAKFKVPEIATSHVKLGNKAKDMLTGLSGHAVIIQVPLFGAARVAIEPTEIKNGKLPDAIFFDEQRVEVIEPTPVPEAAAMPEARKAPGCAPARVSSTIMGR